MDKSIERIFRFIEMIAITALIKAVIVPAYPLSGGLAVGVLTAASTAYLIIPLYDYCYEALTREAKSIRTVVAAAIVSGTLFLIVQIVWLQPLVASTSNLIKTTISSSTVKAAKSKD